MSGISVANIALEELKQPLSEQQMAILNSQLESEKPTPSPQTRFNLGWGLIKAKSTKQQHQGLKMLSDVFRDVPEMRRECLYYLSLGSYKVGDYSNARRYVETLLSGEPDNTQAKALKQSIEEQITRDGLIGLGIAGGALALGVGVLGALLRKKR